MKIKKVLKSVTVSIVLSVLMFIALIGIGSFTDQVNYFKYGLEFAEWSRSARELFGTLLFSSAFIAMVVST